MGRRTDKEIKRRMERQVDRQTHRQTQTRHTWVDRQKDR